MFVLAVFAAPASAFASAAKPLPSRFRHHSHHLGPVVSSHCDELSYKHRFSCPHKKIAAFLRVLRKPETSMGNGG